MKKIISIVLALVMMMSICVTAFAEDLYIKETGAQSGQSTVKTDTSAMGAGTYTVTYPAEISIPWNQTKDATYSVEATLLVGKQVTVSVADKDTKTLTGKLAATDITDTLDYAITGDTSVVYTGYMNETEKITFTVDDWNKTVAEYTGYVTFTATLGDVATA